MTLLEEGIKETKSWKNLSTSKKILFGSLEAVAFLILIPILLSTFSSQGNNVTGDQYVGCTFIQELAKQPEESSFYATLDAIPVEPDEEFHSMYSNMVTQSEDLIYRGDYPGASALINSLITEYSVQSPAVWTLKGVLDTRLGDTEVAKQDYENALDLLPSYVPARVNLSAHYLEHGNYEEAAKEARIAVTYDSSSWEAWLNLASAHQKLDEYLMAAEEYSRALELNNCSTKVWFDAGWCWMQSENYGHARQYFEKIVEEDSSAYNALHNLAICYHEYHAEEDREKALDTVKQALQIEPYDAEILAVASFIFEWNEQPEFARLTRVNACAFDRNVLQRFLQAGFIDPNSLSSLFGYSDDGSDRSPF